MGGSNLFFAMYLTPGPALAFLTSHTERSPVLKTLLSKLARLCGQIHSPGSGSPSGTDLHDKRVLCFGNDGCPLGYHITAIFSRQKFQGSFICPLWSLVSRPLLSKVNMDQHPHDSEGRQSLYRACSIKHVAGSGPL